MSLRAAVRRLARVLAVAGLVPTVQALAVTQPAPGFHCVNGKGVQVRGAYTQQDCHAPYKWVVASAPAAKPAKQAKPAVAQATGKKGKQRLALAQTKKKGKKKKAKPASN